MKLEAGEELSRDKRDACPRCGARLVLRWSGVRCSRCPYWFCW